MDPFWNRELSLWKKSCTPGQPGAPESGAGKAGVSLSRLVELSMKRASSLPETDTGTQVDMTCPGVGVSGSTTCCLGQSL